MRGVVSSGMAAGLEYLGLLPSFDIIYGTSAGAINGAYFVAGQAAYGASIYYEDINNAQFICPLRVLCGDPSISLDFLFEHVMTKEKPLNWRRVVDSSVELVPVATSIQQARAVLLRGARSRYELYLRLKASARIPFVAGPPVRVDGEDCLDGGLYASIPFRQALDDGCTHVLALMTRPEGATLKRSSFLRQYIVSRKLARYNSQLRNAFSDRIGRYVRDLDWLNAQTCAPERSPYVCAVRPPRGSPTVGRFEKSWERLVAGARSGVEAVMDAFGHQDASSWKILFPNWRSGDWDISPCPHENIAIGKACGFPKPTADLLSTSRVEPARAGDSFQPQFSGMKGGRQ
jgi:predicted patatin/cPLA2 family phospholipase